MVQEIVTLVCRDKERFFVFAFDRDGRDAAMTRILEWADPTNGIVTADQADILLARILDVAWSKESQCSVSDEVCGL